MSLLDTASLLVTPNAYKEGKLYSVIPSDGSGDMSVTRATTATRVNSAGLVELVPYNLLTYSNTFTNSDWVKGSTIALTSGQLGYDGTNNAWLLSKGAVLYASMGQAVSSSDTKTLSVYAKANTNTKMSLFSTSSPSNFYQDFDLSNGTLGPLSNGVVSTLIEPMGNGWYRCSVVFSGNTTSFDIFPDNINEANSGSIYIQDAQINEGTTLPYQKTETRLNIPRLDYSNGTCPSLLVEPQRTNLLTYSSSFDNANWAKLDATITANSTTAPDGTLTADKFIANANNAAHAFYQSVPSGAYSFSIYAKAAEETVFSLWLNDFSKNARFDLSSGTVVFSNVTSANITDVGNGWFRCDVYDTTLTTFVAIFGRNGAAYVGNGVNGMFFWGAQVEAGSYATSYIPTTSASVTRNADSVSKTGITSLIGQTEGTIFFDGVINGCQNAFANLFNTEKNTNTSISIVYVKADEDINVSWFVNGTALAIVGGNIALGQRAKIAFAYKSGNSTLYINGVQIGTNTTAFTFPSTLDDIFIGDPVLYFAYQESITNNASALWKTRLTNTQLAQLTTI